MRKLIQNFLSVGLLAFGLQTAWSFSLLGPLPSYNGGGNLGTLPANFGDAWQVPDIGYGQAGEIGGPVNVGEGYRLNVPVIYYACDASFLNYFGQVGSTNIDGAFAILNSLTNASSLIVTNYPFSTLMDNATAESLSLLDLKSETLWYLVEHSGLANPQRFVWTLRDRYEDPKFACPTNVSYLVVQRNFDPLTINESAYINGDLYTYFIHENCGIGGQSYHAVTHDINSTGTYLDTPVAGREFIGTFFTGLTYDDVAGLKYLLSSNNVVMEDVVANGNNFSTALVATNIGGSQLLITSDLGALIAASKINDPVTLMGLYPGLIAYGLATNYSLGWITNTTAYYTVPIGAPYGSPPQLVISSSATPTVITNYVTAFANVVTNHYYPSTLTKLTTVSVTTRIGAPYHSGLLATNVSSQTVVLTNVPSGDYYLIPAGLWGYNRVSVLLTNPVITTNLVVGTSDTNYSSGYSYSQSVLTYTTNYWLLVQPLTQSLSTPTSALRQGVERIQYLRTSYDSLLGQTFTPITNTYTMVKIVNYKPVTEFYKRVLTGPDIVLSAAALNANLAAAFDPNKANFNVSSRSEKIYDVTQVQPGLAGPGVITPATQITFDTSGLFYYNTTASPGATLTTNSAIVPGTTDVGTFGVQWASFNDVTPTNIVVYPNGASLAALEAEQLLQVSPASLTNATHGVFYTNTFTATGGLPPYTWSSPDISANVPGLTVSPGGGLSGTPGTSAVGTNYFTLQVSFSQNQTVNFIYQLIVQ